MDIHKLIGTKLPDADMTDEDKDYLSPARITKWRRECKDKSTFLMHGNLVSIRMASVIGEPNMFFVPEKEDIVVVIANSPMVGMIPECPLSVNYAFYILWPEFRPFDHKAALVAVQSCAKEFIWEPHGTFAVAINRDDKPVTDMSPPGTLLYRGVIFVACPEHAAMNGTLSLQMGQVWEKINKRYGEDN